MSKKSPLLDAECLKFRFCFLRMQISHPGIWSVSYFHDWNFSAATFQELPIMIRAFEAVFPCFHRFRKREKHHGFRADSCGRWTFHTEKPPLKLVQRPAKLCKLWEMFFAPFSDDICCSSFLLVDLQLFPISTTKFMSLEFRWFPKILRDLIMDLPIHTNLSNLPGLSIRILI